jgi:hypothetical protein
MHDVVVVESDSEVAEMSSDTSVSNPVCSCRPSLPTLHPDTSTQKTASHHQAVGLQSRPAISKGEVSLTNLKPIAIPQVLATRWLLGTEHRAKFNS